MAKTIPGRQSMKGSVEAPCTPERRTSPRSHKPSHEEVTTLMQAIIDKLQVLALRRPRALIIAATVLDSLLDESLDLLDESPQDKATGTR
jgi:hypothetical protein